MPSYPHGWLQPEWPAPARVRALFTTRAGGISLAPFDSLNLGDHVHDNPEHVSVNRARLQEAIGVRPVFLQQVHGTRVLSINMTTPDGCVADACVSSQTGVACTVMVADCLPVLFTNRAGTVVAAAHAGWRGLAGHGSQWAERGVLESAFEVFCDAVRANDPTACRNDVATDTLAWLGPCIGPECFEVGAEVRECFVAQHSTAANHFTPAHSPGKFRAHLPALARLRLREMGVTQIHGNDGSPAWCTASRSSLFFSHRRDAARLGSTGRMAASIWLN